MIDWHSLVFSHSGSEGKLTVGNDRVTVLEAIGKLEANSIGNSASMESLVKTVIDKMVPYVQQEGNTNMQ